MITMFNTTIYLEKMDEDKYNKLIDFLEDNNYEYIEDDFEEYTIDNRSESEKYEDWLSEQADIKYDESKLEE